MKILVVSDTHRKLENLKVILEREQPMDLLIHLGDAEGDEDSIAEMAGCRLEIVAGNNDFFSNLPREKELRIGSYRVLITHGHYYYVSAGIADIEREAAAQGYDIVMFGHTHRPVIDYTRDVIALNPGSLSYPRQEGRRPSYIMMDLDKERRQAMRRMEEIRRRIETVASGDLTEEQCRRDAVGMFDKSNTPEEWGYARMFLATKYGEELASEIIEEVEK